MQLGRGKIKIPRMGVLDQISHLLGLDGRGGNDGDFNTPLQDNFFQIRDGGDRKSLRQHLAHFLRIVIKSGHKVIALSGKITVGDQSKSQIPHPDNSQMPDLFNPGFF